MAEIREFDNLFLSFYSCKVKSKGRYGRSLWYVTTMKVRHSIDLEAEARARQEEMERKEEARGQLDQQRRMYGEDGTYELLKDRAPVLDEAKARLMSALSPVRELGGGVEEHWVGVRSSVL